MRAGMTSLLRLLRDQQHPESVAESEWADLLAVAAEENLLPWLAARMSSVSTQLPDCISSGVARIRREAQHKAFAWSAALKHMLSEFQQHGIQVISLKGPWLAERLYGDVSVRSYSDLDFLVRLSDWCALEDILRKLGYSPVGPADHRHRRWKRAGIHIEPHFRLQNPHDFTWDVEALWQRAQLSEFRGIPGWILAPSDELLFLCVHATAHCFDRMSLLLDLAAAFRQLPLPNGPVCRSGDAQLRNSLVLSSLLAARLKEVTPAVPREWIASHKHLKRIADRIWDRSMGVSARSDWRSARWIFVDIRRSGWQRVQHRVRYRSLLLRVLFRSVNEADYAFAGKLNLRRPWQVRMLRPVRLLINECRHAASGRSGYRRPTFLDSAGAN